MYIKPAKKKRPQQAPLTDFFGGNSANEPPKPPTPSKVAAMKPKAKPAPAKKATVPKKKTVLSSDDEGEVSADDSPAPAKRTEPPRRPARAQPKKYIEIGSDDEDEKADETFEMSE